MLEIRMVTVGVALLKEAADGTSRAVFGGRPVEIHMCDEYLETIRVVIPLDS